MIYTPLQGWTQVQLTLSEAEDIFIPADLSVRSFHLSATLFRFFFFFPQNWIISKSNLGWNDNVSSLRQMELLSFIV